MAHTRPADPEEQSFRLTSGTVIRAGWLGRDVAFLTRSLRFLINPASEAVRAQFALEAGDIGVLAVLSANPGVTQNDLALSLVLKKSAVTRVVQRLENKGYIVRKRSVSDRRANQLTLTATGNALAIKVKAATRAQQSDWFEQVSPEDRATFFTVLNHLVDRLAEGRNEGR